MPLRGAGPRRAGAPRAHTLQQWAHSTRPGSPATRRRRRASAQALVVAVLSRCHCAAQGHDVRGRRAHTHCSSGHTRRVREVQRHDARGRAPRTHSPWHPLAMPLRGAGPRRAGAPRAHTLQQWAHSTRPGSPVTRRPRQRLRAITRRGTPLVMPLRRRRATTCGGAARAHNAVVGTLNASGKSSDTTTAAAPPRNHSLRHSSRDATARRRATTCGGAARAHTAEWEHSTRPGNPAARVRGPVHAQCDGSALVSTPPKFGSLGAPSSFDSRTVGGRQKNHKSLST